MQFFEYEHLQGVSMDICKLADHMNVVIPPSDEKTAGLRKLLEAKDCFVRASMLTEK